jgi:exonuclease VII small subunit
LRRIVQLAALLAAAACAFIPRDNLRLNEARAAYESARSDPQVVRHAGAELKAAEEMLQQAILARDSLDDPAVVDHLSYLAKQRVVIAREAARQRASIR